MSNTRDLSQKQLDARLAKFGITRPQYGFMGYYEVTTSRGTLDILLEAGWIRPRGRRRLPGRPVTWGISEAFLDHFGLESVAALPGIEELKAAGLLERRPGLGILSALRDRADEDDADEIDAPYDAVEPDSAIPLEE